MTSSPDRVLNRARAAAAPILMRQGMWSHRDIAASLDLGKSATNQVMASAGFPAPVVGDQRYRRYIPDDVIAWALDRADAQATERRQVLQGQQLTMPSE
jgi:hypothetical protein